MPDYSEEEQRLAETMRNAGYSANEVSRVLSRLSSDVKQTSSSFSDLRRSTSSLATGINSLMSGNTSISSFGNSIGGAISGLENLIKSTSVLGLAFSTAIDMIGSGTKMFANQLDASLKSYQLFSQYGFAGARGLENFRDAFEEAKVPQEMFTQMLTRNSRALTALYTSSSEAAKGFATNMNIFKGVEGQGLDAALRNLGFSSDDVADSFALFADIQRRTGSQRMGDEVMLRQGTIRLSRELELAARITGDSRKEQEAALKRAMENARFQAALRKMEQADPAQAARVRELVTQTATRFPTLSKAIQDVATGFLTSPEAKRMQLTTGNLVQTVEALKAGTIDAGTALGSLQTGAQRMEGQVTSLALAVGDEASIYAPFNEFTDFITIANGDIAKAVVDNKKIIDDVFENVGTEEGQDMLTTEITQAVKNLEAASASVQGVFLNFETISGGLVTLTEIAQSIAQDVYDFTRPDQPDKARTEADIDIEKATLKVNEIAGDIVIPTHHATMPQDIIEGIIYNEQLPVLRAAESNLEQLKKLRKTQPTTMGQFLGSADLAQQFQDKFKLSADTILSPTQLEMLTPMIKREKGFFGDTFPEENWNIIRDFMKKEFPNVDIPGVGTDNNNAPNYFNDLNSKLNEQNEVNRKILSAIQDTNKINKDLARHIKTSG